MKDEGIVSQEIQIDGPNHECFLMRNNSGACIDETGRLVRYGLGNISKAHSTRIKSSDLIGITTITITPDMVGKKIGVFTAVEVKKESWNIDKKLDARETAQSAFVNWVRQRGGFAGFANSVMSFRNIIRNV